MPQIASDAKTYAANYPLPYSARPPQASDQAPATPFASLLDDGAQGAADRPSPPASDDSASRADRPEQAPPPARDTGNQAAKTNDNAKSADAKSADAKSADATSADPKSADPKSADLKSADLKSADASKGKTGKAGKTASDSKVTSDGKAAADAKTAEQAAAGDTFKSASDDNKPGSDGKPTDALTPDNTAAAPATNPVQTITTADAIATALAPAPDAIQQAAPAAKNAAIVATPKATPDALPTPPALQADADKPADDSKLSAKTASQLHTDGKPQPATSDADKNSVADARGEVPANSHRGATVEAPGAIGADANAAAPKAAADAAQPAALTAPSHTTSVSAANPAAAAPPAPLAAPVPLAGVAIEIAGKALAGKNRFEIRLDPPELGRIEVRLDVDRDGNVTSRMIADRSDTLDLLRRDAAGLERALQDAGLKTADNSLQFSLRDHSTGQEQANGGANAARLVVEDEALAPIDATQRGYSRLAGLGSGIDIQV